MKINLSENESYEINLPEEIKPNEFLGILDRFDSIAKLIRMNLKNSSVAVGTKTNAVEDIDNSIFKIKRNYDMGLINYTNTREKVMDLLQYATHGTRHDRARIEKVTGKSWTKISKRFSVLRKKFKIQPHEVGLTRFLRYLEGGGNNKVIVPNYVIKSYTGIFDEKDEDSGEK